MKNLRDQLVKLGSTHPELRSNIRPILAAYDDDDDYDGREKPWGLDPYDLIGMMQENNFDVSSSDILYYMPEDSVTFSLMAFENLQEIRRKMTGRSWADDEAPSIQLTVLALLGKKYRPLLDPWIANKLRLKGKKMTFKALFEITGVTDWISLYKQAIKDTAASIDRRQLLAMSETPSLLGRTVGDNQYIGVTDAIVERAAKELRAERVQKGWHPES